MEAEKYYSICNLCKHYINNECTLDHPCTQGIMGMSDFEPITIKYHAESDE